MNKALSFSSLVLAAFTLSAAAVACAAPTEGDEAPAAEKTGEESAALINTGGGPGGSGETCTEAVQNCYVKCGALYGLSDPYTQRVCEEVCDGITCTNPVVATHAPPISTAPIGPIKAR